MTISHLLLSCYLNTLNSKQWYSLCIFGDICVFEIPSCGRKTKQNKILFRDSIHICGIMQLYKSPLSFGIYFPTPVGWFTQITSRPPCAISSSFSGPELLLHFLSTKLRISSFNIYCGQWHLRPPSCPAMWIEVPFSMTEHLISHRWPFPSVTTHLISHWIMSIHLNSTYLLFLAFSSVIASFQALGIFHRDYINRFTLAFLILVLPLWFILHEMITGLFLKCRSDQTIPLFKSLQWPESFWVESNLLACCTKCFITTCLHFLTSNSMCADKIICLSFIPYPSHQRLDRKALETRTVFHWRTFSQCLA